MSAYLNGSELLMGRRVQCYHGYAPLTANLGEPDDRYAHPLFNRKGSTGERTWSTPV
jgi:hypothetical protein